MKVNYYITALNSNNEPVYFTGFGWTVRGISYGKPFTQRHADYHTKEMDVKLKSQVHEMFIVEG